MAKQNINTATAVSQSADPYSTMFTAFTRKVPTLQPRRRIRGPVATRNLPFVKGDRACRPDSANYWDVPATGGYHGGYKTGESLALMYLKSLRGSHDPNCSFGNGLAEIVESFMIRFEQEGGTAALLENQNPNKKGMDGFYTLRGQYIGFFNTLGNWLTGAAHYLGSGLDKPDESELLAQANRGLQFDEQAFYASLSNDAESEKGGV